MKKQSYYIGRISATNETVAFSNAEECTKQMNNNFYSLLCFTEQEHRYGLEKIVAITEPVEYDESVS